MQLRLKLHILASGRRELRTLRLLLSAGKPKIAPFWQSWGSGDEPSAILGEFMITRDDEQVLRSAFHSKTPRHDKRALLCIRGVTSRKAEIPVQVYTINCKGGNIKRE